MRRGSRKRLELTVEDVERIHVDVMVIKGVQRVKHLIKRETDKAVNYVIIVKGIRPEKRVKQTKVKAKTPINKEAAYVGEKGAEEGYREITEETWIRFTHSRRRKPVLQR
ncbi:unnamed protein product [Microthlaspi erraticum]|uniref:Uncharacterized protein n=1 Tax=Microthlaspi erraticum TaxID=1685480 RepID=A0A6D2J9T6_9BRAS|nr:unnamed protein product [Microthlaspi erraticum]